MPDYAVKTVFSAAGNMVSRMQKMSTGASLFGDKASQAFKKASSRASIFTSMLASQIVMRGLMYLQSGIKEAADQYKNFDQTQLNFHYF